MANATFTSNYILDQRTKNGPKADNFEFCWTLPVSSIAKIPQNFTVTGGDRNCPYKAITTRGINITVGQWALDVKSVSSELLKIYPNPAYDKVVINFNELKATQFELIIIDVLGKEVFTLENTERHKNNELLIDVSILSKGS